MTVFGSIPPHCDPVKFFTVHPFAPLWQPLTDFGLFACRTLLLISPQVLVSLLAIRLYATHGMFPVHMIGLHLLMIVLIQLVFFTVWAQLLRITGWGRHAWFRLSYSCGMVVKGLALNFVYAASFITYDLWRYYLSWENLRVGLQGLEGFYESLGWIVPASLLVFILGVAALLVFCYHHTPEQFCRIDRALNGRAARRNTAILTAATFLLALFIWNNEPNTAHFSPRDPVLSFWGGFPAVAKHPALTPEALALHLARDFDPPKKFHRKNVIIITVDCLRRDHLAAYGYERSTTPFLNWLIATNHAQCVPFAISNGTYSSIGKRSILSARLPHDQQMYDFKVQDALKRAGYRTHLIAAGDNTSLGDMRQFYGANFDIFYDGVSPGKYSVNDDRRIIDGLDKVPAYDGRPAFFYFHFMSAHGLGLRQPEFQQWHPSALVLDWIPMITGRYEPELMCNTYDNGVYQADHYLAQALSILKAKGYLEDYVGVLTGDHGESLGERGHYGHLGYLYMEGIGVPIIFLGSQKMDLGDLSMASQIDIAPTLLSELGLEPPAQWKGKSLSHQPAPETLYAESRRAGEDWRTAVKKYNGGIYQYIRISSLQTKTREMLFNLTADPHSENNLVDDTQATEPLLDLRRLSDAQFSLNETALE